MQLQECFSVSQILKPNKKKLKGTWIWKQISLTPVNVLGAIRGYELKENQLTMGSERISTDLDYMTQTLITDEGINNSRLDYDF